MDVGTHILFFLYQLHNHEFQLNGVNDLTVYMHLFPSKINIILDI